VDSARGFDGGTCDIAGGVDDDVKDGTSDDDAGSPDNGRGNEDGLTRRSNPLRRSGMVSSRREGIEGQQQAHPKAAMAQHGPSVRAEEHTLKWLFGSIEFILLFILFLRVFLNNLCKLEVSLDGRQLPFCCSTHQEKLQKMDLCNRRRKPRKELVVVRRIRDIKCPVPPED